MKIVIDLHPLQDALSLDNPHEFYSTFSRFLIENGNQHEYLLVVSSLFPDSFEKVRNQFRHLVPEKNIRVWYSPEKDEPRGGWRVAAAKHLREGFISSLNPDVVLVFDSAAEDELSSIYSIDNLARHIPVVVVLSPAVDRNGHYSYSGESVDSRKKSGLLKAADLIAVTPPQNRKDAIEAFDLEPGRVIGITIEEDSCRKDEDHLSINQFIAAIASIKRHIPPELPSGETTQEKPRLAFVAPMPPDHTGIAEYCDELLQPLSRYYEIEIIPSQPAISDKWVKSNFTIRSQKWFLEHGEEYSRILYHFGNSHFHEYMFDLLRRFPGTVVLHDFFLGDLQFSREKDEGSRGKWTESLFLSHGYKALKDRFSAESASETIQKYPCNLEVLVNAANILVHSQYAKDLAFEWYGEKIHEKTDQIPHLRTPIKKTAGSKARIKLGLDPMDFLICCFGLLGKNKNNMRLLEAWLRSELCEDPGCKLIFVGEPRGAYGKEILNKINQSSHRDQIKITGWLNKEYFNTYLSAADLAVQLRIHSRGETSGAVLDCMNFGVPTIVNACGSNSELPRDAVWMLEEDVEEASLIEAMEELRKNAEKRKTMGIRAREFISDNNSPEQCASLYAKHIERSPSLKESSRNSLISRIAGIKDLPDDEDSLISIASCLALNQPDFRAAKTLFIDVSATSRNDLKTGIERTSKAIIRKLIELAPPRLRIEPVYLSNQKGAWHYRYAKKFTCILLGIPLDPGEDEPAEMQTGDILLVTDLASNKIIDAKEAGFFQLIKELGVKIHFTIHDLLPVTMPNNFPPGADEKFSLWLHSITELSSHFICVSQTTANELAKWIEQRSNLDLSDCEIRWSHHGADIETSLPANGLPREAEKFLSQLRLRPTFLMVGTIEPRKGHLQTLSAFTNLWNMGVDINLVIVGREGWTHLPDEMRRTIPEIVHKIRNHPELEERLFWLEDANDEFLEKMYSASTCLIAASEGEGFGLPLIEAARHNLPIIARKIPVFQEIAGNNAFYFESGHPEQIEIAVKRWLECWKKDQYPTSHDLNWLTWEESVRSLLGIILGNRKANSAGEPILCAGSANNTLVDADLDNLEYLQQLIDYAGEIYRGPISDKEIIIYAPEKTGSSTLFHTMGSHLITPNSLSSYREKMLHTHGNRSLVNRLRIPDWISPQSLHNRIIIKDLIRYKLDKGVKDFLIVSSFREPISRAISHTFHTVDNQIGSSWKLEDQADLEAYSEMVIHKHLLINSYRHPIEEIEADFFQREKFDKEQKFLFVDRGHYKILMLCLEFSDRWQDTLRKITGLEELQVVNTNLASEKSYRDFYEQFKKYLIIPEKILEETYFNSPYKKYLDWFYTPEEINRIYQNSLKLYTSRI